MNGITGVGNHLGIRRDSYMKLASTVMRENDDDGDKMLNAEEFGGSEELFAKVDKNNDGQIDRGELSASLRLGKANRLTTQLITNSDTDGDNALSAEEMNVAEELFTKIDRNGDGLLDKKELKAHYLERRESIDILA